MTRLLGIWLVALVFAVGCAPTSVVGPRTPEQVRAAEARGQHFQRRVTSTQRNRQHDDHRAGKYHLVRLDDAQPPRIHSRFDVSLFVLSGTMKLRTEAGSVDLRPGESVEIPSGRWYATETVGDAETTVFFVFEQPRTETSPALAAPGHAEPEPGGSGPQAGLKVPRQP